ncbi:hypothetical protein CL658_05485 [bacterium]|nr:hypothetical protein [bacterium]
MKLSIFNPLNYRQKKTPNLSAPYPTSISSSTIASSKDAFASKPKKTWQKIIYCCCFRSNTTKIVPAPPTSSSPPAFPFSQLETQSLKTKIVTKGGLFLINENGDLKLKIPKNILDIQCSQSLILSKSGVEILKQYLFKNSENPQLDELNQLSKLNFPDQNKKLLERLHDLGMFIYMLANLEDPNNSKNPLTYFFKNNTPHKEAYPFVEKISNITTIPESVEYMEPITLPSLDLIRKNYNVNNYFLTESTPLTYEDKIIISQFLKKYTSAALTLTSLDKKNMSQLLKKYTSNKLTSEDKKIISQLLDEIEACTNFDIYHQYIVLFAILEESINLFDKKKSTIIPADSDHKLVISLLINPTFLDAFHKFQASKTSTNTLHP